MAELHDQLRAIIAELGRTDPSCKRFGAAQHRYQLLPRVTAGELAHIEQRLGGQHPETYRDYLDHITQFSAGGAGPFYGLLPAQRAIDFIQDGPPRALPLAHFGCGYIVVMPLEGPAAGQIWLDARPLGLRELLAPSFAAFYATWAARLGHNQWPEVPIPAGACALQAALSGYLHLCEQRLGLEAGQLAGPSLREALADLGPGAIQIAAEGPLFAEGDTVDPCMTCARVIENLRDDGLGPDVVAPGVPPLPARS